MTARENLSRGQFKYHFSPAANRDSISSEGLRPASFIGKNRPQGVYMADSIASGQESLGWRDVDVWEVNVEGRDMEEDDLMGESWVTPGHVPADRVRRVGYVDDSAKYAPNVWD